MSIQSVALGGIERKANWLRGDAEDVTRYVRLLTHLPTYETNAEDAVQKAEAALSDALASICRARAELQSKRAVTLVAAE